MPLQLTSEERNRLRGLIAEDFEKEILGDYLGDWYPEEVHHLNLDAAPSVNASRVVKWAVRRGFDVQLTQRLQAVLPNNVAWKKFFEELHLLPAAECGGRSASATESSQEPVREGPVASAEVRRKEIEPEKSQTGAEMLPTPKPEAMETLLNTLQRRSDKSDPTPPVPRPWLLIVSLVGLLAMLLSMTIGTGIYASCQRTTLAGVRAQLETVEKQSIVLQEDLAKWEFLNDFKPLPLSDPLPKGPNLGVDFGRFRTVKGQNPPTPVQYMSQAKGPVPPQQIRFRVTSTQTWRATVIRAKGGSDPTGVTNPNLQGDRWAEGKADTPFDLPGCEKDDVVWVIVSVRNDRDPIPTEPVALSIGRFKDK
jgi:hypothetical protein